MAKHTGPRPKPKKKIEKVPAQWERLHKQSAKRLVQAEAKSTVHMRTAVRQVHKDLLSYLDGDRAHGLRALKQARQRMANVVSEHIAKTRVRARDAALDQTQAELKQLTKDIRAKGKFVPQLQHRLGSAGEVTASASATDAAAADAVGNAFASRWAQSVMHHLINAESDDETDVAYNARAAVQIMDHQIRRIATTETSKAYNEQHADAVEDALDAAGVGQDEDEDEGENEEGIETPGEPEEFWDGSGVYRLWNAMLDKRTCADCELHDGEIVPVGESFSSRDIPGYVHPNCRCVETIVYL